MEGPWGCMGGGLGFKGFRGCRGSRVDPDILGFDLSSRARLSREFRTKGLVGSLA